MNKRAPAVSLKEPAVVVLFLAGFAFISFSAALQKSLTFDEPLHLYAGYRYLRQGDLAINPEHPPLAKVLAAIPLLALNVNTVDMTEAERDRVRMNKDYSWPFAVQFVYANRNNKAFVQYPKAMMIGLAATLGLLVWLWAHEIYGAQAALASLGLYCLDPNILAHSSIIHTDVPFALFLFAGTYFYWRLLNRFAWSTLFGTILCFALSSVTKFSFLIILPLWVILGAIHICLFQRRQPAVINHQWQKTSSIGMVVAAGLITAYLLIWGVYGFNAVAHANEHWPMDYVTTKETWMSRVWLLNSKLKLLPRAWLYGLADTVKLFDRPSYLAGEISAHGFWLYFPLAFALKTPLPTLVLGAIGLMLMIIRRRARSAEIFLLSAAIVYFGFAVCSRLNIGLRHILPVYPFLFVWLGGVARMLWKDGKRAGRCGVLLLGFWLLFSSLQIYPDYLTFFNEWAGGPKNGHAYLVDSNLDWGQDLKGLKTWMDTYKIGNIRLAYFGTMDPAYYGIKAVPAPGSLPFLWKAAPKGTAVSPYIAISATYLAGLYLPRPDTYAAFRSRKPVASIGNSILVYRLDKND